MEVVVSGGGLPWGLGSEYWHDCNRKVSGEGGEGGGGGGGEGGRGRTL